MISTILRWITLCGERFELDTKITFLHKYEETFGNAH